MTQELIEILNKVKENLRDESDLLWTGYNTVSELRDELDVYINELQNGNQSCLEKLNMHFLPTSTFQELSIQNGWTGDYMKLSQMFDTIYAELKNPDKTVT